MEIDKMLELLRVGLQLELLNKQEMLLIDDIIDIYQGKYSTYNDYCNVKQELIDFAHKKNAEYHKKASKDKCEFFIIPLMLSEMIFNYIKHKGEQQ